MNNYAYVTLLYPNKNKQYKYLDGVLLAGLGLRRQKVKNKLICLVTPDVSDEIKNIIKIIFDEIIIIDYISPHNDAGIKIISDIFEPGYDENMCNVFTKLHIFDYNILPYDKLIFIDSDLIPLNNYDSLFDLDTPAGWLEIIYELDNHIDSSLYTRVWGIWDSIHHNDLIPSYLNNLYQKPGSSINGGLLVIKPDHNLFVNMITKLQTIKYKWFGHQYKHKGTINISGSFIDYYFCPEQEFLTQELSGEWHMIDGRFCSWGKYDENINGLHMAGLKYFINNKVILSKTWQIQVLYDDGFNKISNLIAIWGIIKYPKLKNYLMKELNILIDNKLIKFSDIKKNDYIYNQLLNHQKHLYNVLYHYDL